MPVPISAINLKPSTNVRCSNAGIRETSAGVDLATIDGPANRSAPRTKKSKTPAAPAVSVPVSPTNEK